MSDAIAGFDWDEGNWPKCGKHGVSKQEIEAAFEGRPDVYPATAVDDQRLLAIARTGADRMVFIVFTFRRCGDKQLIRPISARYMHKKEIKHYEER